MKLATNLKELTLNFRWNDKYLQDEDQNVYEELYAKQMKELAIRIEDSENFFDTFYVTGQSGNGKSSALNHLKNTNENLKDKYNMKHLMANEVFDFNDKLTIVDILIMVGMSLLEEDKDLENDYLAKLEELKEIGIKKAEKSINTIVLKENKTNSNVSCGVDTGFLSFFKIGASFKQDWNNSEQTRIEFRKLFELDRRELLDLVNDIIKKYHLKHQDKRLFLILDDLEKKNISDELFTKHKELIEKIDVLKVVMIPVNYATSGTVFKLSLRLDSKPNITFYNDAQKDREEQELKNNMQVLKNLIYKRIDQEHKTLISSENNEEIIEKLIRFSGCNIRQLLRLVSSSAFSARINDSEEIFDIDVDTAIQDLVNIVSISTLTRQEFLKYIYIHKKPQDSENAKFKESIADNTIFAYFNSEPWYDINPVLTQYKR